MGFGRSRLCSWIVEIAGSGARRPSPASESYRKGHDVEARRSDSTKLSSFDEAAVEASRVLPQKEHDRERQRLARDRPGGRIRQREGALLGRLSIESLRVRAGRVPKETEGNQGSRRTSRARPKLEARRQARLHPRSRRSPTLRPGGRPWKPSSNAKAVEEGDSGIERFIGCSRRVVGCRSRNEASSLPGQRASKGASYLDGVA